MEQNTKLNCSYNLDNEVKNDNCCKSLKNNLDLVFSDYDGIYSTFNKLYGPTTWSDCCGKSINSEFIQGSIEVPRMICIDEIYVLDYVLKESSNKIIELIEQVAILGNPINSLPANMINSFESIISAAESFTTSVDFEVNLYESILKASLNLKTSGKKYMVTSKQALVDFMLLKDSCNNYLFPMGMMLDKFLGFDKIFTPEWFPYSKIEGDPIAVIYDGDAYTVIGKDIIEIFANCIPNKTSNKYMSEICLGGALMKPNSAVIIRNPINNISNKYFTIEVSEIDGPDIISP
jgi:hypothetical protein